MEKQELINKVEILKDISKKYEIIYLNLGQFIHIYYFSNSIYIQLYKYIRNPINSSAYQGNLLDFLFFIGEELMFYKGDMYNGEKN